MWKSLEERNLAIIETVMQELGVSDIEELPAKVIELKAAAQHEEEGCNEPAVMFYCETHAP